MTPTTTNETETPEVKFDPTKQIKSTEKVFDLDAKDFVEIVKIADKRAVKNMDEFVALMGNDAAAILAIVNDGLESYDQKQLAKRNDVPVFTEAEDGNLEPYEGKVLGEVATAKLKASQLNLAKQFFGYSKKMTPAAKVEAKRKAMDAVLGIPGILDLAQA